MFKPNSFQSPAGPESSPENAAVQTRQTAEYIEELVGELELLADADGLERLKQLLRQARKEARYAAFGH